MDKKGLVQVKAITSILAAVSFLTGFLLIDRGGISGNVIVGSQSTMSPISIAGLVLVLLSIVLAAYSLKK